MGLVGAIIAAALVLGASPQAAAQAVGSESADTAASDGRFAFYAQSTFVVQGHDAFTSPYRGANSLSPTANARETWDVTLYGGLRLWRRAELWMDGEVDQGFGLSGTVGVAGFPSGEAYKVGSGTPYFRVQRIFLRPTGDLGGDEEPISSGLNQFSGHRAADRLVFKVGKFAVGDIFDTNKLAHDPREDFLNWTMIDAGTFDYAADSPGLLCRRGCGVDARPVDEPIERLLSDVPNSPDLDIRFKQFQLVSELERRFEVAGRPGAARVTGFVSRGRMARLTDAMAASVVEGVPAEVADERRYASRPGVTRSTLLHAEVGDQDGDRDRDQ